MMKNTRDRAHQLASLPGSWVSLRLVVLLIFDFSTYDFTSERGIHTIISFSLVHLSHHHSNF